MLLIFKLPFLVNGNYGNGVCRALWAQTVKICSALINIMKVRFLTFGISFVIFLALVIIVVVDNSSCEYFHVAWVAQNMNVSHIINLQDTRLMKINMIWIVQV